MFRVQANFLSTAYHKFLFLKKVSQKLKSTLHTLHTLHTF
ncbi:hypothetical protein [Moraxella phage Mcat4]|nr:hypothetical protein [Moraxella phage Mcat4]